MIDCGYWCCFGCFWIYNCCSGINVVFGLELRSVCSVFCLGVVMDCIYVCDFCGWFVFCMNLCGCLLDCCVGCYKLFGFGFGIVCFRFGGIYYWCGCI